MCYILLSFPKEWWTFFCHAVKLHGSIWSFWGLFIIFIRERFRVALTLGPGPVGVFIRYSQFSTRILTLTSQNLNITQARVSFRNCSVPWNFGLYMCTLVFHQWCKMNDVENSATFSMKLPLLSNSDAQMIVGLSLEF